MDRHSYKIMHLFRMTCGLNVPSMPPAIHKNTYSLHFSHIWWNLWTLLGWQHNEYLRNFLSPVSCGDCHGQDTTKSAYKATTRQHSATLVHQYFPTPPHGIVSQNETRKYLITHVKHFQNCSDLTEAV